ncbi:MAG: O-antigen ligase family protein [Leptolyngbyaceae cyanobacterium]
MTQPYYPLPLQPTAPEPSVVTRRLLWLEQALTAAALMLYSGGPLNVVLSGGASQGDQQLSAPNYTLTTLCFLLSYLGVTALLFCRWKKTIRAIPASFAILPIVGLAALSYFWSALPDETLSSAIKLGGTSLFGFYIAVRYTPKQQLKILGWAFGLIVTLSLVYAIALPKYGIMGGTHAGTWRGIFTHKNTLGKMMTLSSTVFTLLMAGDRQNRRIYGVFLGLSVLLILLTTSKGALVNLLAMLSIIAVCRVFRTHYKWMVILVTSLSLIGAIAAVLLAINLETLVVDVLGKDPTFTGRTTLWESAAEVIKMQPWLGYGYEAFWHGMDGPSAYIWRDVMWPAPDAHNGFVELTLHLGFVGLGLFLIGYIVNVVRSLVRLRLTSGAEHVWPLTYLAYVFLSNIPEQGLLKSNNIFWVLYVALTVTLFMPTMADD